MNLLNSRDTCNRLGISKRTLNRLMRDGVLLPHEVRNNRLYFLDTTVDVLIGIEPERKPMLTVAYYRVSTNAQKREMENQRKAIEDFCLSSGTIVDQYLSDVGSGINFSRKNFLLLVDMVLKGTVSTVIVTHKDRLARWAFDFLKHLFSRFGCKIVVINLETTSPQAELVEDLMTIVHVFSSRLYGLRRHKNRALVKAIAQQEQEE